MKILFITQYFPPEIGAAPSRSFDLLQEISKKGHEIVVLSETPHYPSSTIVEKYKYSSFYKEDYYELKVIRTFVVVSKRKNFFQRFMLYSSFFVSSIIGAFHVHDVDLVIATSPPLTVGLAGWVVSKLKKCKFVLIELDKRHKIIINRRHTSSLFYAVTTAVYCTTKWIEALAATVSKRILRAWLP